MWLSISNRYLVELCTINIKAFIIHGFYEPGALLLFKSCSVVVISTRICCWTVAVEHCFDREYKRFYNQSPQKQIKIVIGFENQNPETIKPLSTRETDTVFQFWYILLWVDITVIVSSETQTCTTVCKQKLKTVCLFFLTWIFKLETVKTVIDLYVFIIYDNIKTNKC